MKKILALVFCMMLIASSAYAESVTLNILSENEPSWEYAFMQKHPEIEVRHMDAAAEGQAYLTLLMTDNGCDVYELPIGPLYEALKEKGYLLPIEGSDVMDAFAAQLCGYMKPMFLKDNLIYAAPVPSEEDLVESISWGMWRYARDLWEEEGLGAFPATYGELLTRMIEWEKNEDDHGYRLFDAELGPGGFASTILQAYVRQYEKSNEIISFDTPIFREVMLLLKEYQDVYQPLNDCQALISSYCGYLAESCDEGYMWIAPPTFEEGQTAPIGANTSIYVISARTKHREEAIAYVEAAVQSLNKLSLLMMTCSDPCELKSGNKTVVTKEQIEILQSYVPQVQFNSQSIFLSGEHYYDMEGIIHQYLHGILPLDMMITQLNQRAVMASKEQQ